ncbi:hypothetical protein ACFL2R_02540 [Patescibacteria group bacterium]
MGILVVCVVAIVVGVAYAAYFLFHLRCCLHCDQHLDGEVKEFRIVFSCKESSDGSGELIEDKGFLLCEKCFKSGSLDYDQVIDEFEWSNESCSGEELVRLKSIVDKINRGEFEMCEV